jgi:hypothetical protein
VGDKKGRYVSPTGRLGEDMGKRHASSAHVRSAANSAQIWARNESKVDRKRTTVRLLPRVGRPALSVYT